MEVDVTSICGFQNATVVFQMRNPARWLGLMCFDVALQPARPILSLAPSALERIM